MQSHSVAEVKSGLSAILKSIQKGDTAVITRRGKPVARIVPENQDSSPFDYAALRAYINEKPVATGMTVADMRAADML